MLYSRHSHLRSVEKYERRCAKNKHSDEVAGLKIQKVPRFQLC